MFEKYSNYTSTKQCLRLRMLERLHEVKAHWKVTTAFVQKKTMTPPIKNSHDVLCSFSFAINFIQDETLCLFFLITNTISLCSHWSTLWATPTRSIRMAYQIVKHQFPSLHCFLKTFIMPYKLFAGWAHNAVFPISLFTFHTTTFS